MRLTTSVQCRKEVAINQLDLVDFEPYPAGQFRCRTRAYVEGASVQWAENLSILDIAIRERYEPMGADVVAAEILVTQTVDRVLDIPVR